MELHQTAQGRVETLPVPHPGDIVLVSHGVIFRTEFVAISDSGKWVVDENPYTDDSESGPPRKPVSLEPGVEVRVFCPGGEHHE